ncbi:MAG TPA: hypothetical protein PLV45_03005, partial [bacterium]|nr:hypothetical protein [bacterium]
MKPVSAALLHVTAVFAASVASSRIAAVLPGASDVPDELLRVITVILPGTLVLQSALITLLTAGHRNRDRSRYQDALFVILINASAILLPISGGRNLLTFSTGMWIVTGLLIRSVFMTRCLVRYMTSNPAGPAALLTGILVFLLILPLAGWRLTARPLDGDEPYYLLQSYSMLHDHDLDLKNNYLDGDSLSFVPRKLQPQQFDDYENGRLLSRHPPLMSLVLIPGFAVAGNHGAIVTILILTALLGSLMVVVLKNFCLPYSTAIMVAVLICLTAPVILYSTAIFTETAGAVLGMAAVAVALKLADRRKLPYAATALVLAGAFALKPRFAILTLPPIIAGIAFRYGFSRRLVRIISFLGLMVISVAAMNLVLYGNPLVRHSLEDLPAFSFTRLFRGTVGLFWDPQYGAFPLNPLMFLAVPGAIILLRRASASRRTIWLSSWIPYFCSVAIMAELSGGICPRGRFNVAWLPLFGIAAAFALHAAFQSAKRWCVFPAVISSVTITGLLLLRNDWQIVYPGSVDHMISKLSLTLNRDILSVLPGFDRVNSQLYATGGMLAFLTVMAGLIPLLSPRWLRRIRLPDVTGSVLVILCLMSVLVAGCNAWQTPWMHTEDVSFESRGNVRMFWEETRDWEFRTMSPSPYRAGQRIHSGGELVRALPFRPPEHPHKGSLFLEIEARGSVPDHSVPRFSVRIDDSPKITVRLRSTVFEIYRIQCPDDFDPERSTLTIDIPEETGSAVWCDIDRMRLAYQPFIPREIPPHPDRHLPIEFDRWEVRDARLTPENILQGESVELALEYDLSHTPAPAAAVLLKSGTRTSYHPLTLSEDPGI